MQCNVVQYDSVQCIAVQYNVVQCIAVYCIALHCIAFQCSIVLYNRSSSPTGCCAVQWLHRSGYTGEAGCLQGCCIVKCNAGQCRAVWCSMNMESGLVTRPDCNRWSYNRALAARTSSHCTVLYLYYDKRRDIRWNIDWARGISRRPRLYFTVYHDLRHNTDILNF